MDRFKFRIRYACKWCGEIQTEYFQLRNPFDRYSIACQCGMVIKQGFDATILSVEQCTGYKDKKGNLSFEGDKILIEYRGRAKEYVIVWQNGFVLSDGSNCFIDMTAYPEFEIIGNIHDEEVGK